MTSTVNNKREVLVVGRGVYALPLLRILGMKTAADIDVKVILATSVGMQDIGSLSRFVNQYVTIPRPDRDLEGFTTAICELAKGKPNLTIIPVAEETLFLSLPKVSSRIQQACAPRSPRILTSPHEQLAILNDKYQFQKCMAKVFANNDTSSSDESGDSCSCIPQTSLVHNETDLRTSVQACFDKNKGIPAVVIKPLSGHGSIGAHIVKREHFERPTNTPQDLFSPYTLPFEEESENIVNSQMGSRKLSIPYVAQEFVEGHEYSTLSLCLEGVVVGHACYRPRQVGTHGFSPIRDLAPPALWKKTLEYVQRVATSLKLTGHFGFDMMQRFNGENLVALECNPRVTNGMSFFSPRFSSIVATKMKLAYLGLWDKESSNSSQGLVISPGGDSSGQDIVPRHIMTLLPMVSCLSKAKFGCERGTLLEVAAISYDDVWWLYDPVPFFSMILRIGSSIVYAIMLQILPCVLHLYDGKQRSVSEIVRTFVVDEVVSYDIPTEASTKTRFETIGGLRDGPAAIESSEAPKGLRVLVTGATGFLGGRVVRVLNQGLDNTKYSGLPDTVKNVTSITATGRNEEKGRKLMESLDKSTGKETQFTVADLSDAEETYNLVEGHDVVIHCAALCTLWTRWDEYIAANVTATQNVAQACQLSGISLLVHISSPSVAIAIDSDDRTGVKESDPLPSDEKQANRYSATKKMAEAIVTDVAKRYALPCIILRPRAIFGPGDTTLFPLLLNRIKSGKLAAIGNAKECFGDFTYVDNVVAACLCCLDKRPLEPTVYAITNDDPRRLWGIIEKICERMKLDKPRKKMPFVVAYTAACMLEIFSAVALLAGYKIEPLVTRYTVNVLAKTSTFDISRAKHDLGYRPVVGFDEGVERFLKSIDLPAEDGE